MTRPFASARSALLHAAMILAAAMVLPAWAQGATSDTRAPTAPSNAAKPAAKPATPRQRIELPAAERQALEAGTSPASGAAPTRDELVPTEADAKAAALEEPATRIEQIRTSNRISEIRVTPAMTGRTYTITNREGQQPISATDTAGGLSLPKFFNFEFGRPAERPTPGLPAPPPSNTR
jgi:hypothetical protein